MILRDQQRKGAGGNRCTSIKKLLILFFYVFLFLIYEREVTYFKQGNNLYIIAI